MFSWSSSKVKLHSASGSTSFILKVHVGCVSFPTTKANWLGALYNNETVSAKENKELILPDKIIITIHRHAHN